MENHHFWWENSLLMAIFNSYVKLPEGMFIGVSLSISHFELVEIIGKLIQQGGAQAAKLCWFLPSEKYPLVNFHIAMERSTMLLMEQSTISMAIFNSFLYVYQMVSQISSQFTQLGKQRARNGLSALEGPAALCDVKSHIQDWTKSLVTVKSQCI